MKFFFESFFLVFPFLNQVASILQDVTAAVRRKKFFISVDVEAAAEGSVFGFIYKTSLFTANISRRYLRVAAKPRLSLLEKCLLM